MTHQLTHINKNIGDCGVVAPGGGPLYESTTLRGLRNTAEVHGSASHLKVFICTSSLELAALSNPCVSLLCGESERISRPMTLPLAHRFLSQSNHSGFGSDASDSEATLVSKSNVPIHTQAGSNPASRFYLKSIQLNKPNEGVE